MTQKSYILLFFAKKRAFDGLSPSALVEWLRLQESSRVAICQLSNNSDVTQEKYHTRQQTRLMHTLDKEKYKNTHWRNTQDEEQNAT